MRVPEGRPLSPFTAKEWPRHHLIVYTLKSNVEPLIRRKWSRTLLLSYRHGNRKSGVDRLENGAEWGRQMIIGVTNCGQVLKRLKKANGVLDPLIIHHRHRGSVAFHKHRHYDNKAIFFAPYEVFKFIRLNTRHDDQKPDDQRSQKR
jgi:hypothetical protein